ncbi:hypothetical protein PV327_002927 [Microctonus hyperodae]|uniref:Uncharacterized protein n=1 Tax=Microctonus hyperodae TaxID=165561 RepID=A0AA39G4G1_MICHY|nr:hypothetical protein PV327_002927 [Microctonus hyperodae]
MERCQKPSRGPTLSLIQSTSRQLDDDDDDEKNDSPSRIINIIFQEFKDINQHAIFLGDFQQPVTQKKMISKKNCKTVQNNLRKKEQKENFKIFRCLSEGLQTKLSHRKNFFWHRLLIASYRECFADSRTLLGFLVRSLLTELLVTKVKKDFFALIEDNSSANHPTDRFM